MSDFDKFEPYIVYNENIKGNNNRLFVFPPGIAGAESYFNNIVPRLHNKNLVLFNNYYLYLETQLGIDNISYITYENLANDYICYIKSIQPEGPYNLFGWSFGGILAFEIARQLINTGDILGNIVLVDPFFNYKRALKETNTPLSEIDINNINYKYSPLVNSKILHKHIVLFKALRIEDINSIPVNESNIKSKNIDNIYKYYAKNTVSNHLDDILKNKKFRVISMDCSHGAWVNNSLLIIKICNEL